jgi:hypothetical protein
MEASSKAFSIKAEQLSTRYKDKAIYYISVSRKGGYFWGLRNAVKIRNHNGAFVSWAAPAKSDWSYSDDLKFYKTDSAGNAQTLSYEFWDPQPGYITGSSLYYQFEVDINRGNKRQESKTIYVGIDSTYTSSDFKSCGGNLTLYTSKIADVSNVLLTVTADDGSKSDRYIHVSASFTNQENHYTGTLYRGKTSLGTTKGSISKDIPITYDMFEKTETFYFKITGADGTEYPNSTKQVPIYIEPSGVGIWNKKNNKSNEVYHMYYKKNANLLQCIPFNLINNLMGQLYIHIIWHLYMQGSHASSRAIIMHD